MKKPAKHIAFLDGLRAIAILGVLVCHTYAEVYGYGSEFAPWKGWFRTFASGANLGFYPLSWGRGGVALFFVISGFCIHLSFRQPQPTWRGFFIRRLFRLYPAYLTAFIFVLAMLFARHIPRVLWEDYFWTQLATHVFFIHNFFSSTFKGINPALWSLAIEAQLYLLYPLLLALVAKLNWLRTLAILAVVESFLQVANGWAGMTGDTGTAGGRAFEILGNSPLGYWFSWAIGAAIGDAFLKKQPLPFLNIHPLFWFAAAVSTDFIKPLQPLYFIFFALASAAFLSRRLHGAQPSPATSLLSSTVLMKIGLWSYSIYLLHYPLLEVYHNLVDWYSPQPYPSHPQMLLLMFGTWAAIIPLAALWHKTIELPGIAFGKRLTGNPAAENRFPPAHPRAHCSRQIS